jgi:hypothetical protein
MEDAALILVGLALAGVLGWAVFAGPTYAARQDAIKQKKDIDDEVNKLSPADLDKRFKRWMRD